MKNFKEMETQEYQQEIIYLLKEKLILTYDLLDYAILYDGGRVSSLI